MKKLLCLLCALMLMGGQAAWAEGPVTLTALGAISPDIHDAAMAQLPGVQGRLVDEIFWTEEEMLNRLLTHDPGVDIYGVEGVFVDPHPVFNKGFAYPIPAESSLNEIVSQMFPALQELVTRDGQVLALPVAVSQSRDSLSVNLETLAAAEAMGFTLPKDYLGFLDSLAVWDDRLADEGIFPFMGREDLYELSLKQYITACDPLGSGASLDDALLTALLEKARAAAERLEALSLYSNQGEGAALYIRQGPQIYTEAWTGTRYLPLPLAPGMPVKMAAYVSFLFVNRDSPQAELAGRYLEAYWAALPADQKQGLLSTGEAWVENNDYAMNKESIGKVIQADRERLAAEKDPAMIKDIQNLVNQEEKMLADLEAVRYIVTPESLRSYQEYMASAAAPDWRLLKDKDVKRQVNRLTAGQMNIPEFVTWLNRRLEAIRAER